MKCPDCEGRGFTEQFHGLLQLECGECMGSGEMGAVNSADGSDKDMTLYQEDPTVTNCLSGALLNDPSSGTGQPDSDIRTEDTGQPKLRKKRAVKKKARAKTG